jgi:hypothetical protein
VFQTGIETTKTNRTFSKQTEKISKKSFILGCPQNNYFFSVQTKTNRNSICFGCFSVCAEAQKKFGGFVSVFRTSIEQPKLSKLMVWGIKKVYI